jgi:uncharacterized lipoprotein
MRKMILIATLAALAACSSPPKPKQPDESNWEPVNKTLPAEVEAKK